MLDLKADLNQNKLGEMSMKILLCTLFLSCSLMAEQDVTFNFELGVTVYCGKEEVVS